MLEPAQSLLYGLYGGAARVRRAPQQQHRYAERAGSSELGIGRRAAAVLRNQDLDAMELEQVALCGFVKGPSCREVTGMRNTERAGIHAAYQVTVLRRGNKRREIATSQGQKNALRRCPERANGSLGVGNLSPAVPCHRSPGGATDGEQRRAGVLSGVYGVGGDLGRIRVGRIDEDIDVRGTQELDHSSCSTETAAPCWHRLAQRCRRPSCERQHRGYVVTSGEACRETARLRRTAQNQNAVSHE